MRSTLISVSIAAGMGLSLVAGAVASTSSLSSQPVATPKEDVQPVGYHYKGGGHGHGWHYHWHCHWGSYGKKCHSHRHKRWSGHH